MWKTGAGSWTDAQLIGAIRRGLGHDGRKLSAAMPWNYFSVLGAAPALGRAFDPSEDRPGAPHVVILSRGLWQARFGSDQEILGRAVTLDNTPYQKNDENHPCNQTARSAPLARAAGSAPMRDGAAKGPTPLGG